VRVAPWTTRDEEGTSVRGEEGAAAVARAGRAAAAAARHGPASSEQRVRGALTGVGRAAPCVIAYSKSRGSAAKRVEASTTRKRSAPVGAARRAAARPSTTDTSTTAPRSTATGSVGPRFAARPVSAVGAGAQPEATVQSSAISRHSMGSFMRAAERNTGIVTIGRNAGPEVRHRRQRRPAFSLECLACGWLESCSSDPSMRRGDQTGAGVRQ
jgi:hypothetical protein